MVRCDQWQMRQTWAKIGIRRFSCMTAYCVSSLMVKSGVTWKQAGPHVCIVSNDISHSMVSSGWTFKKASWNDSLTELAAILMSASRWTTSHNEHLWRVDTTTAMIAYWAHAQWIASGCLGCRFVVAVATIGPWRHRWLCLTGRGHTAHVMQRSFCELPFRRRRSRRRCAVIVGWSVGPTFITGCINLLRINHIWN